MPLALVDDGQGRGLVLTQAKSRRRLGAMTWDQVSPAPLDCSSCSSSMSSLRRRVSSCFELADAVRRRTTPALGGVGDIASTHSPMTSICRSAVSGRAPQDVAGSISSNPSSSLYSYLRRVGQANARRSCQW